MLASIGFDDIEGSTLQHSVYLCLSKTKDQSIEQIDRSWPGKFSYKIAGFQIFKSVWWEIQL